MTLDNGDHLVGDAVYDGVINTPAGTWTVDQSDIAWQTAAINAGDIPFTSGACFDPTASNKIYMGIGVGVVWASYPATTYVAFRINVNGLGIESLVNDGGISMSVPGGYSWGGFEDRGNMPVGNPQVPALKYVQQVNDLVAGTGCDYSSSDHKFICFAQSQQYYFSGYTTDATVVPPTIHTFTKQPVGSFVNVTIAAASPTNMVMTINNGNAWTGPGASGLSAGVPIYTTDQGANWATCQLSGGGDLPSTGWNPQRLTNTRPCAADRSAIGTFYMQNLTDGLLKSTDGGATWTILSPSGLSFKRATQDNSGYCKLRCSPYDYSLQSWSSDIWYSGALGSGSFGSFDSLWHCTDGGNTWAAITGVTNVSGFDFGASRSGTGVPALIVYATIGGKTGAFICEDYTAGSLTWTQLLDNSATGTSTLPLGLVSPYISSIFGDGINFGRVYLNYNIGTVYYQGTV